MNSRMGKPATSGAFISLNLVIAKHEFVRRALVTQVEQRYKTLDHFDRARNPGLLPRIGFTST